VPVTLPELTTLPGVGRKTANVVLGNGLGVASGVVVDTHVKRLAARMGFTVERDPEKVEKDLMALLPKGRWISFSNHLIYLGRETCTARKPACGACPVCALCPKVGVK
jgi:endonuclease-3